MSSHVSIGRNDTQNYSPFVLAVSGDHFLGDSLNVFGLVADWDSCDAWKVNESKVHAVLVIDLKDNWVVNYAAVGAAEFVCELLNFGSDFLEVIVDLVVVEELSIWSRTLLGSESGESELKWSSSDDS